MKNQQFTEFIRKGIECKIDKNHPDLFQFTIKKDNKKVNFISDISESTKIADSGLINYKLIDGYEAIYSSSLGIVECQLGNFSEDDYEKLCCYMTSYKQRFDNDGNPISTPPSEIIFNNEFKAQISIGYYSKPFKQFLALKHNEYIFKRQNKFTLKISDIIVNSHDEAKKNLKEFGYSVLFEIDINYYISITLQQDQPNTKRNIHEYIIDEEMASAIDNDLDDMQIIYPSEPTSYFLKANVTHDLRFYQFLLFYHCLEYYFPQYSYLYLKDPIEKVFDINSNKNGASNDILDVIRNKLKVENERDLLKVLLNYCFDQSILDINNYIEKDDILKKYFINSTEYKAISEKPIYSNGKIVSLDNIALRIHDIRCAIAHKKNDPRKNKLYPNLRTFELIKHDIKLLKYIAKTVIEKHSLKH